MFQSNKILLHKVSSLLDNFSDVAEQCGASNRIDVTQQIELAYDIIECVEARLIKDVIAEELE